MNKAVMSLLSAGLAALAACGNASLEGGEGLPAEPYTVNTRIEEVITDPAFGGYCVPRNVNELLDNTAVRAELKALFQELFAIDRQVCHLLREGLRLL